MADWRQTRNDPSSSSAVARGYGGTCGTTPRQAQKTVAGIGNGCRISVCLMPRWRNRQTRQVEGLVRLIPRAGSTPVLGILVLSSEPSTALRTGRPRQVGISQSSRFRKAQDFAAFSFLATVPARRDFALLKINTDNNLPPRTQGFFRR